MKQGWMRLFLLRKRLQVQMHEVLPESRTAQDEPFPTPRLTCRNQRSFGTHLSKSSGGRAPGAPTVVSFCGRLCVNKPDTLAACTRPMPEKIFRGASQPTIVAPSTWIVPSEIAQILRNCPPALSAVLLRSQPSRVAGCMKKPWLGCDLISYKVKRCFELPPMLA